MKTNKWIYAIVIASLVWVGCDDDDDKIIDPTLNDTDELFVEKAARSNMAEIKFSEIAVAKSTDSLIRSFAKKMVDEHTKAQNELQDIADDFRGVEWPNDLDEGHESIKDQLDSIPAGYSFDTLFLGTQERTHLAAKTTFQTATTTTTETRVKSYATKYLPFIEEHLSHVDSLQTIIMEGESADDSSADGN
ncbi:MAG TPA: DUF4142 domain-containing protein [Chryseosolibacter sp.]|nr:DUF4142 domain-containing protein [Chryseosolibacter sp.]